MGFFKTLKNDLSEAMNQLISEDILEEDGQETSSEYGTEIVAGEDEFSEPMDNMNEEAPVRSGLSDFLYEDEFNGDIDAQLDALVASIEAKKEAERLQEQMAEEAKIENSENEEENDDYAFRQIDETKLSIKDVLEGTIPTEQEIREREKKEEERQKIGEFLKQKRYAFKSNDPKETKPQPMEEAVISDKPIYSEEPALFDESASGREQNTLEFPVMEETENVEQEATKMAEVFAAEDIIAGTEAETKGSKSVNIEAKAIESVTIQNEEPILEPFDSDVETFDNFIDFEEKESLAAKEEIGDIEETGGTEEFEELEEFGEEELREAEALEVVDELGEVEELEEIEELEDAEELGEIEESEEIEESGEIKESEEIEESIEIEEIKSTEKNAITGETEVTDLPTEEESEYILPYESPINENIETLLRKLDEKTVPQEMNQQFMEDIPEKISDEVALVPAGMKIHGNLITGTNLDVYGEVEGNLNVAGKLSVHGNITGGIQTSELFVDEAKIIGNIKASGTVKIGPQAVIIGDINANSAVIAGAVKGDIDIHGPVVLDENAIVKGNIRSAMVQINSGAVVDGKCIQCYGQVNVTTFFEKY